MLSSLAFCLISSIVAAEGPAEEGALINAPFRFSLRPRFYPVRPNRANHFFFGRHCRNHTISIYIGSVKAIVNEL
jgi:hypothetical protein